MVAQNNDHDGLNMPLFKQCCYPCCCRPRLEGQRYCSKHLSLGLKFIAQREKERQQKADAKRREENKSSTQRGYGYKWQKISKQWRKDHPLCVMCEKQGIITPAECVDHIVPHRGDPNLLYDLSNLQSLCWKCHSRKTVKEDGGFGKSIKR